MTEKAELLLKEQQYLIKFLSNFDEPLLYFFNIIKLIAFPYS